MPIWTIHNDNLHNIYVIACYRPNDESDFIFKRESCGLYNTRICKPEMIKFNFCIFKKKSNI